MPTGGLNMHISVEITRVSTPWVLLGISKSQKAAAGKVEGSQGRRNRGADCARPGTEGQESRSLLTILDKYLVKEVLGPFGLCIGGFTIVLLSGYLFELVDLLFVKKVPADTVMRLLGYKLPSIVALTLPLLHFSVHCWL